MTCSAVRNIDFVNRACGKFPALRAGGQNIVATCPVYVDDVHLIVIVNEVQLVLHCARL